MQVINFMEKAQKTIILVGNPNVGKSVIFNRLTGSYAVVSNYPGTTVDISRGMAAFAGQNFQIIDTPGTHSLIPSSEDEKVTRDVLLREKPQVIVQIADAKNLSRTLQLTFELMELNIPVVLALNMHDEALARGIRIDRVRLEKILGIGVVETVGITGEGMGELSKAILRAKPGTFKIRFSADIESLINDIEKAIILPRAISIMIASGDKSIWHYVNGRSPQDFNKTIAMRISGFVNPPQFLIFNTRNMHANEIVGEVQSVSSTPADSWLAKLGQISMRPFPGYLIVAAVLFIMYEFVGVFAAGIMVNFFEKQLFGAYLNPFLISVINNIVPFALLREFLVGPYGAITMAVTYALAIVFPIVSAFFFFFGFLEDSGYLPRLSVMLDRMFRAFGLNGKAVLPMVLGLGCGTMAAMGSRILETKKERLLVILLLSLTIPCSAQLGVILGLLSGLSWKVAAIWFISITGSLFFVGAVANKILPGRQSPFILEIPPLRVPSIGNIATKVKMRLTWYLKEAVPLFILGTAILFAADKLKLLGTVEKLASPIIVNLLGLPAQVTQTFILGFLRRDYGAAGLFKFAHDGLLTYHQIAVSIVAITLFVPCIAQCFIVMREKGWKTGILILLFVSVYAFLYSGALNLFLSYTSVL